jgi:hypothetical protein
MRIRGKQASLSLALAIAVPLIPCLACLTPSQPPAHRYPGPVAAPSRLAQVTQAQSRPLEWPTHNAERPGKRPRINPGRYPGMP